MTTKISTHPTTTLIATRTRRREYELQNEDGQRCASLRVGWPVRQGEIRTEHGTWPVRRRGWRHITAGDNNRPLVCLQPEAALVPGTQLDTSWTITRNRRAYQGTLTRDGEAIVLRMPALSGRRCEIEVTGDWEKRDLVVLTAYFALLARRRRDITIMVVASGSHGP